jgi:hypothetical protein
MVVAARAGCMLQTSARMRRGAVVRAARGARDRVVLRLARRRALIQHDWRDGHRHDEERHDADSHSTEHVLIVPERA